MGQQPLCAALEESRRPSVLFFPPKRHRLGRSRSGDVHEVRKLTNACREIMLGDDALKKFLNAAALAGVAAELLSVGGGVMIGPLLITLDM